MRADDRRLAALSGKTVVVTGASSGIGAATAQLLATYGANLVLAARSEQPLQTLAAALPGAPLVMPVDLSDDRQARHLIERALALRGHIDILINNAGIGITGSVTNLPPDDLWQVLAVNLAGPLATIQAVVPHMRERGQGHVINVSSILALWSLPQLGGYCASKAALERLTDALRVELIGSGIAVTSVRPGRTRTAFAERRLGNLRERWRPAGVPPERVAATIAAAIQYRPRVAYVTLSDRLLLLLATLLPGAVDQILARLALWEDRSTRTT